MKRALATLLFLIAALATAIIAIPSIFVIYIIGIIQALHIEARGMEFFSLLTANGAIIVILTPICIRFWKNITTFFVGKDIRLDYLDCLGPPPDIELDSSKEICNEWLRNRWNF